MIRLRSGYRSIGIRWASSAVKEMHACELLENGCLGLMFAPTNVGASRVKEPVMKVVHVPCGPAVNESERKALERIKSRLRSEPGSDEWLLLTNLAFSATHLRQSDEIDIVAIGPPGVQIVEVKHWTETWIKRNIAIVERESRARVGKSAQDRHDAAQASPEPAEG